MKARIQAGAQIDAIIVSAPEPVRAPLPKLIPRQRIRACAALRPGPLTDPAFATKAVLRSLARRWQALRAEIHDLDGDLTPLVTAVAPELVALPGVGVDTARQLLVTPATIPADCARIVRSHACAASRRSGVLGPYRPASMHRGGDRDANSALWRIALVRVRLLSPTSLGGR